MAAIYLVRHGQAGFNKLNYDQLSALGHGQAELVGKVLAQRGIEAGKVIHGTLRRHIETCQGAHKHWHSYGQVLALEGFNEFDSDEVIAKAFPQFDHKLKLGAWLALQPNRNQAFQQVFSQALNRWVSGTYAQDYQEPWPAFKARVVQSLFTAIGQAAGKDLVIFTSGGPISVIAQHCLDLSNEKTLALNWTIVNASISQLLYSSSDHISLASFNEQQHLLGQQLTYR